MSTDQLAVNISDGIGAHSAWRLKLKTAITTGYSDFTVREVSCDDKYAGDVLVFAITGRGAEAMTLLNGDFTQQSETLVSGLQKMESRSGLMVARSRSFKFNSGNLEQDRQQ